MSTEMMENASNVNVVSAGLVVLKEKLASREAFLAF